MDEKTKHLLEIGGVIVGGLAVLLLMKHSETPKATAATGTVELTDSGAIPAQNPNPATDYLTFNWPPKLVNQVLPGVPSQGPVVITANGSSPGNGCGCEACNYGSSGLDLAPSFNALAENYTDTLTGLEQNYTAQVEAATPTWFSSYFNNQAGALATEQTTGAFLNLMH